MFDDVDPDVMIALGLGLLIIVGIIIGYFGLQHHNDTTKYEAICATNPRLRYINKCTTYDDCLAQCVKVVRDGENLRKSAINSS